jgi:GMP synthase-like glutamine amidotransferase
MRKPTPIDLNVHLGICFGHQVLSRALGGKCEPNIHYGARQWETGVYELELTPIGKELFGTDHLVSIPHDALRRQS